MAITTLQREPISERLTILLRWLRERDDRFASAKPPTSRCITGVALQMEEQAEAERRAARKLEA